MAGGFDGDSKRATSAGLGGGAADPGGAMASDGLSVMAGAGVNVNLMLMALNLLPIPPLDGGRIAVSLLPHSLAAPYSRVEPYGFFVVIVLLATGLLNKMMLPLLSAGEYLIRALLSFV